MGKFKKICILFLCITFLSFGFADTFAVSAASTYSDIYKKNIRVVLLENELNNITSLDFKLQGSYLIDGTSIAIGDAAYTLKLDSGSLALFKGSELVNQFPSGANVSITSQNYKSNLLTLTKSGRRYTGHFDFINNGTYIGIVNKLGIDEYLYGVVPYEIPESSHLEALKAQAVAARTFAFNKMITPASTYFDLGSNTNYQVYGGYSLSYPRCKSAVDSTKGTVMTYNGKPIEAFFSASNGGYTEKSENVWSGSLSYIDSVPDTYDTNYKWARTFTSAEINERLSSSAKSALGEFTAIDVNSITKYVSGRIKNITLNGTAGTISFSKNAARTFLYAGDTKDLLSALYTVSYDSSTDTYTFSGSGYGHGVGMSQIGAQNRALSGKTYSEILAFYYPNSLQESFFINVQGINPSNPNIVLGQSTDFTTAATGGNQLLYQYYIYNESTQTKSMVQDYSTNASLKWTFNEAGNYQVMCFIKDINSISEYDKVAYCETTVNPPAALTPAANLAAGKVPASSYSIANISRLTDGDKSTNIYYGTTTGSQWVQLDLGSNYNLNSIKLWHYFGDARKYHDVIVQLSNDPTFKTGVTTVFNNDMDNTTGLGTGADGEYAETPTGKDLAFGSVNARYVRFYSNGSTANAWNHYVEIEVYGSGAAEAIHPTSITLNKTTDSIAIGETDKLTPTFTPENATNKNVTWSSSDAAIVSVSSDGTITGVKAGAATITVKTEDSGFAATCKVNVGNLAYGRVPASSYSAANISRLTDGDKNTNTYYGTTTGLQWVQLDLGTSYNLNDIKLWHYFSDARKYHDVIVQLSNDPTFKTGVINVYNNDTDNSAGLGLGAGTGSEYSETISGKDIPVASVNARYVRLYSNGSTANAWNHYVEIEVYGSVAAEVIHPTSVTLSKTTDYIAIGATDKLTPTFAPANATNKNVTWSSSDAAVASVSSDGTVTGVKAGAATITAKAEDGGFTATCSVNVVNLAYGKASAASYSVANISRLTDGDKDTNAYYGTTTGLQWVQLDLGTSYNLNDIKLWHYFKDARKYHDVIVQLSNDSTFKTGVTTVFNNDADNSAGLGLGAGTDSEYSETVSGKDVPVASVNARYVRFYSNGNSINAWNHYVEIEVYGK